MKKIPTAGERIAEDWACGRLPGTVAEAIDEALEKAKSFAYEKGYADGADTAIGENATANM